VRSQGTADRHDPEPVPVSVDERADQRRSGSCSRAKKPAAADRISIVRSSSDTLRLSSRISFAASDRSGDTVKIDAAYVHKHIGDLAKNADLSRFIL